MAGGNATPEARIQTDSDEAFQRLLLRVAAKAAERTDPGSLIQLFCRLAREFFQCGAVCFWRRHEGGELVGEQADGVLAEDFVGLRLLPQQSGILSEVVRSRRTPFANGMRSDTFPAALGFDAHSLMVAPLVVFDEVIGVATFVHDSKNDFFSEDLTAKATVLAGQLGSLLEAARRGEVSREEHRRAEILAGVATALHA